jgi:hypothetical protein
VAGQHYSRKGPSHSPQRRVGNPAVCAQAINTHLTGPWDILPRPTAFSQRVSGRCVRLVGTGPHGPALCRQSDPDAGPGATASEIFQESRSGADASAPIDLGHSLGAQEGACRHQSTGGTLDPWIQLYNDDNVRPVHVIPVQAVPGPTPGVSSSTGSGGSGPGDSVATA